jgi:transcriptional regulator with XRE-family HTH domain
MRSASLRAGLGHNYIHGILKEDKDATVDRLLAICKALNVSPAFILLGQTAPPEVEELLLLMQANPERREAILALLRL